MLRTRIKRRVQIIMDDNNCVAKRDKHILLTWAAMAVVPLMVHIFIRDNIFQGYSWFSSNETNADFFLICKMYGLFAVMAAMIIFAAADIFRGIRKNEFIDKLKYTKIVFIFACMYLLLSFMSAVFAHDVKSAFIGGYAQYEPVLVLLAYIIIFMFTYCYVNSAETLIYLCGLLTAGIAVISFIGVMQYAGIDFFGSNIGKSIITMFSGIDADKVSLKFERGRVYMSLYNPNYVGSYVALVLPVVTAGIVIFKKIWMKSVSAAVAAMLAVCLVGSGSVTGMTAVIISAVLFIAVLFAAKTGSSKKIIIASGLTCLIAVAVIFLNLDIIKNAVSKYRLSEDNFTINKIELTDDGILLDYKGSGLSVECNNSGEMSVLTVSDSNGTPLELAVCDENGGMAAVGSDFYSDLVFGIALINSDMRGSYIKCGENVYVFTNDNDEGKYLYFNPFGKTTDEIKNSDGILFDNYERFASGRGFIWSRTIPLLAGNMLIGCGPDNFVYKFPNDDYVSMINNGYYGDVVTRPHNMYLQTGVQTGVVSLVLFILIYMIYFIQCIRIYTKKSAFTVLWMTGVSVMAGTLGYMVCGLANDSTVCVAPVFWGMLGIGYACNYLMKKQADIVKSE